MPPVNFRLLLVTDRRQTRGRPLPALLNQAVLAGVPAIQLRERDLPTGELLALAQEIQTVTASHAIPLIINDRIDLALALDLAGVHLRSDSLPVPIARRLLGSHRLIGISTHSVEEVRRANRDRADYIVLGPIFDTPSKHSFGPALGLDLLTDACRQSTVPIFAIGGITRERVCEVRQAGAHGVAVIGALLTSEDVGAAIREFRDALDTR